MGEEAALSNHAAGVAIRCLWATPALLLLLAAAARDDAAQTRWDLPAAAISGVHLSPRRAAYVNFYTVLLEELGDATTGPSRWDLPRPTRSPPFPPRGRLVLHKRF